MRVEVIFLLTLALAEGCLYGPGCVWPCNCQDSAEVCDPETGVCPLGGCKMGLPPGYDWEGEGCRTGNIALGKNATMSATSSNEEASLGVDGNTNPNLASGSCVQMSNGGSPSGYMVDLGTTHVIQRIVMYNTNDQQFRFSMGNLTVFVSNASMDVRDLVPASSGVCGRYPGNVRDLNLSATIPCTEHTVGRYVMVKNGENQPYAASMPVCEMVVIGHKAAECDACLAEAGCDLLRGCNACPKGKMKPDCKRCLPDFSGPNCEIECHCRETGCSESGVCESGCPDWYIHPTCDVHISAPDMSRVTPTLFLRSGTSVVVDYPQLEIDESLANYYEYVVEMRTPGSEFQVLYDTLQSHTHMETTTTEATTEAQTTQAQTTQAQTTTSEDTSASFTTDLDDFFGNDTSTNFTGANFTGDNFTSESTPQTTTEIITTEITTTEITTTEAPLPFMWQRAVITGLQSNAYYEFRVRPARVIRELDWKNNFRQYGAASEAVLIKTQQVEVYVYIETPTLTPTSTPTPMVDDGNDEDSMYRLLIIVFLGLGVLILAAISGVVSYSVTTAKYRRKVLSKCPRSRSPSVLENPVPPCTTAKPR